jgi:hypothetical protein
MSPPVTDKSAPALYLKSQILRQRILFSFSIMPTASLLNALAHYLRIVYQLQVILYPDPIGSLIPIESPELSITFVHSRDWPTLVVQLDPCEVDPYTIANDSPA